MLTSTICPPPHPNTRVPTYADGTVTLPLRLLLQQLTLVTSLFASLFLFFDHHTLCFETKFGDSRATNHGSP